MPPSTVKRNLLLPVFVTIQAGEPDPLARLLRHIYVGHVPKALPSKTAQIVNDNGRVRPVIRRCESE